ncbi:MAG: sodium:solute symporter family protein, partial [Pseudomonadota bacterium]
NVFWITLFIGTIFASSWGPMAFMSVWSSTITAGAAFWGMAVGFTANVVPAALDYAGIVALPSFADPALLGIAASLLTIYLISAKQSVSKDERDYREALHRTPEEDKNSKLRRTTLIAPALLFGYGLTMPFLLLRFYVLPYQRGSDQLLADGALNWSHIEPWIAFGPSLLFLPLGAIAFIVIRRRYAPDAR